MIGGEKMKRDWLKLIRLGKNLTHSEVADAAGIKRAYYTMIELGERRPSVAVAKSIANVLDFEWPLFFEQECNESKHFKVFKEKEVAI